MSADEETLRVYGARAKDYAGFVEKAPQEPFLDRFIAQLPKGGRVLDLGCGPGQAAAYMAEAGLAVDATDGAPEMVDMCAAAHPAVTAWIATFDELSGVDLYDGIWANFSLLHAPRAKLPEHLSAMRSALKPGGALHIGMKAGAGEARDKIGRLYTYYTAEEMSELLEDAGFRPWDLSKGSGPGLDGTIAPNFVIAAHG